MLPAGRALPYVSGTRCRRAAREVLITGGQRPTPTTKLTSSERRRPRCGTVAPACALAAPLGCGADTLTPRGPAQRARRHCRVASRVGHPQRGDGCRRLMGSPRSCLHPAACSSSLRRHGRNPFVNLLLPPLGPSTFARGSRLRKTRRSPGTAPPAGAPSTSERRMLPHEEGVSTVARPHHAPGSDTVVGPWCDTVAAASHPAPAAVSHPAVILRA